MVRVERNSKEIALIFSENEAKNLGLSDALDYEAVKAKENIIVVLGKEKTLEESIYRLLEKTPLKNKVEGRFEKMLTRDSLKTFKEMLRQGKIIKFKLSPKYKKAIYKTIFELGKPKPKKESPSKESQEARESLTQKASTFEAKKEKATEKTSSAGFDYSLKNKGYLALKDAFIAKQLNDNFAQEFKSGAIKGVKSFEGIYYMIQSPLYEKTKAKILPFLEKNKTATINQLTEKFNLEKNLIKAVCELLKEEGEISEKRKELMRFIE